MRNPYKDYSSKAGVFSFFAMMAMLSPAAHAQMVDYGSLEDLFGESVTTAATGKPQKASEAPVALEIVSADQIRRMGVTSLPEVLNRVPGLTNWQATRSWSDIGIRGQNSAYNPTLLVLVNGRQVYIDSFGFTDWSLLPVQLEEIRQVEVVKGPATALYGFNAVSGVVNIVTYNPKYDDKDEAGIVAGTDEYGRAYGFTTLKLSDAANVRFSGNLETFDEFDLNSKTQFSQQGKFQGADDGKFLADSVIQLSDKTQLRLEGSYAATKGVDVTVTPTPSLSDKSLWAGKVQLTSETALGLWEANIYTNSYHNNLRGGVPGTIENQVTVAQLQDLFKIGTEHTFRLQGEYRHNRVESDVYFAPGASLAYDSLAAGGMWNWALTPNVEWTNALRLDHLMLDREGNFAVAAPFVSNSEFDTSVTDYSANTGIVWKATERDTLRASYGRGIQAPSLFGFGVGFNVPPGVAYVGNPNLDAVVVHNYEVGYDRLLDDIGGKFRGSLFYKKTQDIQSLGGTSYLSGSTFVLQGTEVGDSKTAGVELGLIGTVGQEWDWDISYIYQNTIDSFISTVSTFPSPIPLHYENTVPHHVIKGHIGYETGPWQTDLFGEIASSFNAVASNGVSHSLVELDSYYTVGGRVAYTFENDVTLALHGSELAQARVANNYGLENERRLFISLSKRF